MTFLVTATVDGRTVGYAAEPAGDFPEGAWYEHASGLLAPELTLRWLARERGEYYPRPNGEATAFIEAEGGKYVLDNSPLREPAAVDPGVRPPVY